MPARLLVFGGIALVLAGMFLGEVYAIFVSHVANGEVGRSWAAAIEAIGNRDLAGAAATMRNIEKLQELRGRTMDTHSHLASYGILALVLAMWLPSLSTTPTRKTFWATLILAGGLTQGLFVYVRIYGGQTSSYFSDAGGVLLLAGFAGFVWGFLGRKGAKHAEPMKLGDSPSARIFARGGTLLILLGMCFGFYYAWVFVTQHEPGQNALLQSSLERAAKGQVSPAKSDMLAYRGLQSRIAITAAAHSHVIEYGMLAILLAFLQPQVLLKERWKKLWAWIFVLASLAMGLCIFGATIFGLRSAGLADTFGVFLILSITANLAGIVRRTGAEDAVGLREANT